MGEFDGVCFYDGVWVDLQHCTVETPSMYLSKPIYNMKRGNKLFFTFWLLIYELKQTLDVVVGGRGKTDSSRQIKKTALM